MRTPRPRWRRSTLRALTGAALAGALSCGGAPGSEEAATGEVRVHVEEILLDEGSHSPVVVLGEDDGDRHLPIWIGFAEARSIAARLQDVPPVRPNTHDLVKSLLDGLEARVVRVVVTDLDGGIYYARIHLAGKGTTGAPPPIDARPSDAIALALRAGAPVYVSEGLFERSRESGDGADDEGRRI